MTRQETVFAGFWQTTLGMCVVILQGIQIDRNPAGVNTIINFIGLLIGVVIVYMGCKKISKVWPE